MLAHGFPPCFFIDAIYTIVGSLLNKELHVQLGRYKSRSRHWMNGVAAAGQGKSPTIKPIIEMLMSVLKELSALAPGSANDMFHTCQSTTTAAAIDKIRATLAYLLLYSDDAGRCVSVSFAQGGKTDRGEHLDLTYFLDAAHGDEFSHQTCRDREKLFKKKTIHPSEPVPVPEQLCLNPTNVHVLWLLQELYFAKYWAQLAVNKPIGIVQRVLFSFSTKVKEKNVKWNGFLDAVIAPILKGLFRMTLRTFGPKAPGEVQSLVLSPRQTQITADIEETLTLFSQRKIIGNTMRDAMPKSLYWLGTALLGNWVTSSCMEAVVNNRDSVNVVTMCSDAMYVTCVNFLHRRYLYGHNVLACAVKEDLCSGIDARAPFLVDDLQELTIRALRLHPGAFITTASLLLCDIQSKRIMELGSDEEKQICTAHMRNVFETICDLGLGERIVDPSNGLTEGVKKYARHSLPLKGVEWLRSNRVSLALFGPVGLQRRARAHPGRRLRPEASSSDKAKAPSIKSGQNNNKLKQETLTARKNKVSKVLCSDVVQGLVMDAKELKQYLSKRCEFQSLRVQFKYPKPFPNVLITTGTCNEDASCPVEWDILYCTARCGSMPKQTLQITQLSHHDHTSLVTDTGVIFTPEVLELALDIVQRTANKELSFRNFKSQLLHRVEDKKLLRKDLPTDAQMTSWLKRTKRKKAKGSLVHVAQTGSGGMVENTLMTIASRQKWFTEKADELIILPRNPLFETCLISEERTVVIFASKGMFETLRRFRGERGHITVDTKMKTLKRQRGVVTVYLNVKDGLRNTSFHVASGRVQGLALTTHSFPVLQAIINEETSLNHVDLFAALEYLWNLAHPQGPAFEVVFRQISKDFAPGIEAARRERLSFTRPLDDFFHFMGKNKEMESRCKQVKIDENRKPQKSNLGWSRAVLYDIQNGVTVDLLSEVWAGFLRRLICIDEITLAMYLCLQYSQVTTVQELRTMNVFANNPELEFVIFFLPWSGGFAIYPGSNSGSLSGEAAHSPWQSELQRLGSKWELEDALSFMQRLYTDTWQRMYKWGNETATLHLEPQQRDPQLINGKLLGSLDRSTMFDFCTAAKEGPVAHVLDTNGNVFVVMPRNTRKALPSLEAAMIGCRIISSSGKTLRDLLLDTGILHNLTEEERRHLAVTCLFERERCSGKRLAEFPQFLKSLGISEDFQCTEPIFSLARYHAYFSDVVYVVRDHPASTGDSWPFLRCTCDPFSKYASCEHREYARTLPIAAMREDPVSSDNIAAPSRRGRAQGSHTTARGKAAALSKSVAKEKA